MSGPGQQQHLGLALLQVGQPLAPLLRDSGYSVQAPQCTAPQCRIVQCSAASVVQRSTGVLSRAAQCGAVLYSKVQCSGAK